MFQSTFLAAIANLPRTFTTGKVYVFGLKLLFGIPFARERWEKKHNFEHKSCENFLFSLTNYYQSLHVTIGLDARAQNVLENNGHQI